VRVPARFVAGSTKKNELNVEASEHARQAGSLVVAPAVPDALRATPVLDRHAALEELEQELGELSNPHAILAGIGAQVIDTRAQHGKPRFRPIMRKPVPAVSPEHAFHEKVLAEIQHPIGYEDLDLTPPLEESHDVLPSESIQLASAPVFGNDVAAIRDWYVPRPEISTHMVNGERKNVYKIIFPTLLCAILIFGGLKFGLATKDRILEHGASGVQALENAKENLKTFNFVGASEDFSFAYEKFAEAGEKLNIFGASMSSLIASMPGGGKLKSAQSIIEIGKLVSDAGQATSEAVDAVVKTGMLFDPKAGTKMYLGNLLAPVREALVRADKNFSLIATLLGSVQQSDIPEEKRTQFQELNNQMPVLRELVGQALGYTQFMERLAGSRGEKRYLVLFQNPSELRPTGGFAGSYGILEFEDGTFKNFSADDVYNIDGQLTELYVPPRQIQHITPNWAMRDAAWFVDFSASARKVMSFYEKEAGKRVDGVITINTNIVSRVLNATGPLSMPAYGLTLTGENFLAQVQNEVEYGENKKLNKPKQIIIDMVPRMLAKLAAANRATWLAIIEAAMAGVEEHDILMYFTDQKLQQFARDHAFSGEVAQPKSDYLMITATNIKGSKTDAVTDTSLKLTTQLEQASVRHTLAIMRQHTGGKSKYGFYNRQNPAFVRVLVPQGSKLIRIVGNSQPNYAPMMNYPKTDFQRDADLEKLEATMRREQGIVVFEESGKTEFGFWMIVDSGEIKTVELEYEVPSAYAQSDYQLYLQKQPGIEIPRFEWNLVIPADRRMTDATPRLTVVEGAYHFVGSLAKDLSLRAVLE
jgi:hypothetical protein